jgi:glycerol-3-phosphate dehydrogenase
MTLADLADSWDLIVAGGGVTGAGVFQAAVAAGWRTLLLEQRDFAWGTSSRSSKLVHGGLRYLSQGRLDLMRDSVRERERLLRQAPGLVEPLDFLVPLYAHRPPQRWMMGAALTVYAGLAGRRAHHHHGRDGLLALEPTLNPEGLRGGYRFTDAQTDDARLVLRLIFDARRAGGSALNYTRLTKVERYGDGRLAGVVARDVESGAERFLGTRVLINATGAWAEALHPCPDGRRLRPLRGSHLILPRRRLPLRFGVTFFHPDDRRAVFLLPWEETILVGTTDIDHLPELNQVVRTSAAEARYLLRILEAYFPHCAITARDCLATMAGVRPILTRGRRAPSREPRDHAVWRRDGVVTVTGGKLTTFRLLARDALRAARPWLPVPRKGSPGGSCAAGSMPVGLPEAIPPALRRRLQGRYGTAVEELTRAATAGDLETIPGTRTIWAEVRHAAAGEQVRHLDDLLLRRVRVGLQLPQGGSACLEAVERLCAPVSNWSPERWQTEKRRYLDLWQQAHALPGGLTG